MTPRRRPHPWLAATALCAGLAGAGVAAAAIQGGGAAKTPLLLVGADDDSTADVNVQPPAFPASDQSLRKSDVLGGGQKDDLLIGRLGPDFLIAGPGDDVMVGGTEAGSDVAAFPAFDNALGGLGDDVFIWTPGDGSDAYSGGEDPATTTVTRRITRVVTRNGRKVRVVTTRRVTVPAPKDDDVLILGTLGLAPGDDSQPEVFQTPFGPLPRVNVSGVGLPATIGVAGRATVKGFCQLAPGTPGSNWQFLVRFFTDAGQLQATIRVRNVERVLCRARGQDTITEFALGDFGDGPPAERGGFVPR
ncbi:MAG: hypothetical protein AB1416_13005, partial [Actinomycetota bacterium]